MNYCAPPKDKCLLLNNKSQSCAALHTRFPTTTRMRELNHLWEVFLPEKADFSKLNISMLHFNNKVIGSKVSDDSLLYIELTLM